MIRWSTPGEAYAYETGYIEGRADAVKHGHWKIIKYPTGIEAFGNKEMTVQSLMCSNCSYEIDVSEGYFEYCPNCGSFMDWEYEE